MTILKKAGGILTALSAYAVALAATYGLLSLFFTMSGVIMFIVTGVLALLLLSALFGTIMAIMRRANRHELQDRHEILTKTINEIANGNFNVFVDVDENAPHHEIAKAVNDMVQNLGSLEAMRQDFISNVSHEIQSPLTSIGGFANLLKDDELPPEQRRHYAGIIEAESKRLSGLSENLLKLSSLDNNKIPPNKTDFRLDKQLEAIALTLEPQWSAKNITFEADLQKYTINADKDLLSQVWVNLLHNAIKFTPDGGAITVTLKDDHVTIADTGIGISDEDKMHIFERFYKVDKARDRSLGGNGLGLSLVKKIIELHGGTITVQSEPGKGTAFKIILPGLHSV